MDYRTLSHRLAEVFASTLQYFEHCDRDGAPQSFTEASRALSDYAHRYRNDVVFHAKVDTLVARTIDAVRDAESRLLPGTQYMDPPDGGDVDVDEQLRRLAQDAARYRHMRDSARFESRNGPGLYWYLPRTGQELPDGDRLDLAVDDAIRAKAASRRF